MPGLSTTSSIVRWIAIIGFILLGLQTTFALMSYNGSRYALGDPTGNRWFIFLMMVILPNVVLAVVKHMANKYDSAAIQRAVKFFAILVAAIVVIGVLWSLTAAP